MKHFFLHLFILLILPLGLSCSKKESSLKKITPRESKKGLTQSIAKLRKSNLSNISYLFEIDLRTANVSSSFTGISTIIFNFSKSNFKHQSLTLDFEKGLVNEIYVNGKRLSNFKYNNYFISIPITSLKEEKNILKIKYSKKYSKDGNGLYKFKDSLDKNVYLYTNFEPYAANLFAPMFDQPNLKASYSLNVITPLNWIVISSVKEQQAVVNGDYKKWSFPKSQKFSTYLFSLHAGPYKIWEDKVKLKSKEISLRLFSRQSLAKYVKPNYWFKTTKQSFNFFEQYFSTDYPYTKYDQVIVPDFNPRAMENVAAVTFHESYIHRESKPLRSDLRNLSVVIFHEMAHMWFGNLVTMNWWNNLWLNESFATYMAFSGLYYNTEYKEAWLNFFNSPKKRAYSEDQWSTTHPVETNISSTNKAFSNFDAITYGKGAAILKQLIFFIGEDKFKLGLADYFRIFAEQNTKLKDFISTLQTHTSKNLTKWTSEWLQTKGLNSITTEISCHEGTLTKLIFIQSINNGDQIFRTHKLKVALWNNNINFKPQNVFTVIISGKKTLWKPLEKISCPKAVFPNWNDYGFINVNLDSKSSMFISDNINEFESDLFKSQFWSMINNDLRLGKIPPEKIIPILKKQLSKEKNPDTLNSMLSLLYPYISIFDYYSDKNKAKIDRLNFSKLLKTLIVKTKNPALKKIFFREWVYNTYQDNPTKLYQCLSKCPFDIGFKINIDKKWLLAKKLSNVKYKDNSYTHLLFKEDPSRKGFLNKLGSEASFAKNKNIWLSKALNKTSNISLKERIFILSNLIPHVQRKIYFKFIQESFFKNIDKIYDLPQKVQNTFANNFSPFFCGEYKKNISITKTQIKNSAWSFGVQKILLKQIDIEARCLKIKALSQKAIIKN